MRHEMNVHRRASFALMKRATIDRHLPLRRVYFETEVMNREMALNLERLGWLKRYPGIGARRGSIRLTDFGLWVLGGVS